MTFESIIKAFGLLDAVLIIAIIVIFREWRKSEKLSIDLLREQIAVRSDMITRYNSFESVLKQLSQILKD